MSKYTESAQAKFSETHDALQLVVDELNQGQRQKIVKNEEVKALLDWYEVDYGKKKQS